MDDDAARHISRDGLAALEAELRKLETEGRGAIADRLLGSIDHAAGGCARRAGTWPSSNAGTSSPPDSIATIPGCTCRRWRRWWRSTWTGANRVP